MKLVWYNEETLERQETNKNGRGTERHLPTTDVSIAKTYRDETKLLGTKSFASVSCILLLRKATVFWPKYSF